MFAHFTLLQLSVWVRYNKREPCNVLILKAGICFVSKEQIGVTLF